LDSSSEEEMGAAVLGLYEERRKRIASSVWLSCPMYPSRNLWRAIGGPRAISIVTHYPSDVNRPERAPSWPHGLMPHGLFLHAPANKARSCRPITAPYSTASLFFERETVHTC
jgi:hypothetical protein